MCFHPGCEQATHPVVMAQRTAEFLNLVDDAALEGDIFVHIHAGKKDEVEICPLRVEVRGMRHAHGVRTAFDVGAHTLVQTVQVVPGDAGLQRIDQDAVIVQILAHVRFGIAGVFPFARGITAQGDGAMLTGDALDFARHQAGIVPVSLDIAQASGSAAWA